MNERIGVLSLEGTYEEHERLLKRLQCRMIKVEEREDLIDIRGLIITGRGNRVENLIKTALRERIKELAAGDFPILGLSAGMVLLSKGDSDFEYDRLGLMDLTIARKPIPGRMEACLVIPALGLTPIKAIFSDAPYIQKIAPNVGILAEYNDKIVFVRQGNMLAGAFQPEQTGDGRIHRYFLDVVKGQI